MLGVYRGVYQGSYAGCVPGCIYQGGYAGCVPWWVSGEAMLGVYHGGYPWVYTSLYMPPSRVSLPVHAQYMHRVYTSEPLFYKDIMQLLTSGQREKALRGGKRAFLP